MKNKIDWKNMDYIEYPFLNLLGKQSQLNKYIRGRTKKIDEIDKQIIKLQKQKNDHKNQIMIWNGELKKVNKVIEQTTKIQKSNESITLYKDDSNGSAAITATVFPLAFPLIAGPGSLTTLLSLRAEFAIENIIIAVILNVIFLYIVLKTSSKIERLIGASGIQIIRKVFGVILLAISVKLFAQNIKMLFI